MTEKHLCPDTDDEMVRCLIDWTGKPSVYGPCSDEHCGGVCEFWNRCKCWCHTKFPLEEGAL